MQGHVCVPRSNPQGRGRQQGSAHSPQTAPSLKELPKPRHAEPGRMFCSLKGGPAPPRPPHTHSTFQKEAPPPSPSPPAALPPPAASLPARGPSRRAAAAGSGPPRRPGIVYTAAAPHRSARAAHLTAPARRRAEGPARRKRLPAGGRGSGRRGRTWAGSRPAPGPDKGGQGSAGAAGAPATPFPRALPGAGGHRRRSTARVAGPAVLVSHRLRHPQPRAGGKEVNAETGGRGAGVSRAAPRAVSPTEGTRPAAKKRAAFRTAPQRARCPTAPPRFVPHASRAVCDSAPAELIHRLAPAVT